MDVEKLLFAPEEAAAALGIGRTKVFELIRTGELESLLIGKSRRIRREAIVDYIRRRQQAQNPTTVPPVERPEAPLPAPQRPSGAEGGGCGKPRRPRGRRKPEDNRPRREGPSQPPLFGPWPPTEEPDA